MAISRERLEELIEKEATIYSARILVREISLNDLIQIYTEHGEDVIVFGYEPNDWEELKDLYETRKEAEWHLKYNATRIEELDLPTWEEFKDYNENVCIAFIGEDWEVYELSNDYDLITEDKCIILTKGGMNEQEWQATEENYEKACDLCLKLFKGEEE